MRRVLFLPVFQNRSAVPVSCHPDTCKFLRTLMRFTTIAIYRDLSLYSNFLGHRNFSPSALFTLTLVLAQRASNFFARMVENFFARMAENFCAFLNSVLASLSALCNLCLPPSVRALPRPDTCKLPRTFFFARVVGNSYAFFNSVTAFSSALCILCLPPTVLASPRLATFPSVDPRAYNVVSRLHSVGCCNRQSRIVWVLLLLTLPAVASVTPEHEYVSVNLSGGTAGPPPITDTSQPFQDFALQDGLGRGAPSTLHAAQAPHTRHAPGYACLPTHPPPRAPARRPVPPSGGGIL